MQQGMSDLPLKVDMCGAATEVCFGPKVDLGRSEFLSTSFHTKCTVRFSKVTSRPCTRSTNRFPLRNLDLKMRPQRWAFPQPPCMV